MSTFSFKNKKLVNNAQSDYPDNIEDINWYCENINELVKYGSPIVSDRVAIEHEKYRASLGKIHLADEEINIINVLFHRIVFNRFKKIKINDMLNIEKKDYIIDNSTQFKFKCIWCKDDPFAFYISKVTFSEANTKALLRYWWKGSYLNGRGFTAYFEKKNNKWKRVRRELAWLS